MHAPGTESSPFGPLDNTVVLALILWLRFAVDPIKPYPALWVTETVLSCQLMVILFHEPADVMHTIGQMNLLSNASYYTVLIPKLHPSPLLPLIVDSDWLWPLVRQYTGVMPLPLTWMGTSSSSLLPYLQPSVYLTTLLLSRGHSFLGAPLHIPPSQTLCGLHGIWELAITIFIFDMRELVSRDLQGPELITAWAKNSQTTSSFSEICLISLAGLASGKPEPVETLGQRSSQSGTE